MISVPIDDPSRPRVSAVVAPSTATRSALALLAGVEEGALPHLVGADERGSPGSVPMTVVVSFSLPATTRADVDSWGATPATPESEPSAVASSRVSVVAEPNAPRVAPDVEAPGLTVSRFVPRPSSRLLMPDVAPCATETSATTDATPMMMPSMVSAVRSRPVPSRVSASPNRSRSFMR